MIFVDSYFCGFIHFLVAIFSMIDLNVIQKSSKSIHIRFYHPIDDITICKYFQVICVL